MLLADDQYEKENEKRYVAKCTKRGLMEENTATIVGTPCKKIQLLGQGKLSRAPCYGTCCQLRGPLL
jgi:hypothetical protein